jgi:hypothetical protein
MIEPTEREDLDQLLASPGWVRFAAYVKKQWGPEGYGIRLKQAVTAAIAANQDVSNAVSRVDAANDAVNEVLTWPRERVKHLEHFEQQRKQEQTPTMSRRGSL